MIRGAACLLLLAGLAQAAEPLDAMSDSLASSINTTADEREPFLAREGRLLLFSSNRSGAYRILGVAFPGLPPASPIPRPLGTRPLPEMPWLGGPGDQRSPVACGGWLYYRSEADWGAGLYQARFEADVLEGAEPRLLLRSEAVRPLLQGIGLRLDGPWWLPDTAESGVLLIRRDGRFEGWRLERCEPAPLTEPELLRELPWLADASFESVAWLGPGLLLATRPGQRGRLDFQWLGPRTPPISGSFVGNTLDTEAWDELEATAGPEVDGRRLVIFSRENNTTRHDANLWLDWLTP